jgi:hypothetical protein
MADDSKRVTVANDLDAIESAVIAVDAFAAARTRALVLALDATPAERVAWLEEAIAIAYASGALPRRRGTR